MIVAPTPANLRRGDGQKFGPSPFQFDCTNTSCYALSPPCTGHPELSAPSHSSRCRSYFPVALVVQGAAMQTLETTSRSTLAHLATRCHSTFQPSTFCPSTRRPISSRSLRMTRDHVHRINRSATECAFRVPRIPQTAADAAFTAAVLRFVSQVLASRAAMADSAHVATAALISQRTAKTAEAADRLARQVWAVRMGLVCMRSH
jgi:hypothetical protein